MTALEAEEPVSALLERIFGATPTIYTNIEKGHSVVTAYLRARPADLRAREGEVRRGLEELGEMGLETGSEEILIQKVPREDWSESWKKYFKTIRIGGALIIKPSWSKLKAKRGQAVVVLDPGLSFGTGQHATTLFCLKQIVLLVQRSKRTLSFLDAGCGSGILAISAAKLGCAPVEAFDFDPVAVRIARKNCQTNGVESKVKVARRDLTKLPAKGVSRYDLICANLVSDLLIAQRDKLLNRLRPGGTIVLAGMLASEFASVQAAYEGAGFSLTRTTSEREWQSGSFRRNSK